MKLFPCKQAMTLVELIVSLTISGVVLLIVFSFISQWVKSINETQWQTEVTNDVFVLKDVLNKVTRSWYTNFSVIRDAAEWLWNDVLLIQKFDGSSGYIIGVVNNSNLSLSDNVNFSTYWNKILWYRELSAQEIIDINADINVIDSYTFFNDKVFEYIVTKEFQADLYNLDTILDMTIIAVWWYSDVYDGESWDSIAQDNLLEFNLVF